MPEAHPVHLAAINRPDKFESFDAGKGDERASQTELHTFQEGRVQVDKDDS